MSKIKKTIDVEVVESLRSSPVRQTRFLIEESDDATSYPFCALPEHFFDLALMRGNRDAKETTLLSIDTWDGREIFSVIRKQ